VKDFLLRELPFEQLSLELLGSMSRLHEEPEGSVGIIVPIVLESPNVVTSDPEEWSSLTEHTILIESLVPIAQAAKSVALGKADDIELIAVDGNRLEEGDSRRVISTLLKRRDIRAGIARVLRDSSK
jgi:hypothetical protein